MYRCALLTLLAGLVGCEAPEVSPVLDPVPLPEEPATFAETFQGVPAELQVTIDPVGMDALRTDPREWVSARVTLGEQTVVAEARLKGNGSFRPVDDKPSLKLRLDQPLGGRRTLVLNNTVTDPTRVAERLASEAYRLAGVPAARAGSAWVELNGEPRGIYTVLEDVDRRFLHRDYADSTGSLYEIEDADFSPDLLDGFELKEGEPIDSRLAEVADALALGDVIGFDAAGETIDREAFLQYLATTAWVAQTDAYPYSSPGDDAYLYLNPATDRLAFLPHGLDEAFAPRGRDLLHVNGLLARRCLASAPCRAELSAALSDVENRLSGVWEDEVDRVLGLSADWGDDPRLRLADPTLGWTERRQFLTTWLDDRGAQLALELP